MPLSPRRFVIFSTGHAGSTWLSRLFIEVAGVPAFHEPVTHLVDRQALEAALADPESSPERRRRLLAPYLGWLEHRGRE
jgi:hypothetical protein